MACAQNEETCLSLCSLRSLWQEEKKNHKERKDRKEPDGGGSARGWPALKMKKP
jgi:hypothetical protein